MNAGDSPRLARGILGGILSVVVMHGASAQTAFSDLALRDSPARHQALAEAAKKEGTLTFYTSIPEKDMARLNEDFTKRYGVKVVIWRASTDKILQRLVAEKRASRWDFDAVDISSP